MRKYDAVEEFDKEGLGLINGTQMFTSCGALRLYDSIRLIKTAIIASAMSADALRTPGDEGDSIFEVLHDYSFFDQVD